MTAGRPFKTYKYGLPIQEYKRIQRKILSEQRLKEKLLNPSKKKVRLYCWVTQETLTNLKKHKVNFKNWNDTLKSLLEARL